jgi:4-aminobutyrate---pyruvate transaminase
VLARHGIPLIADEVICGFGRTGQMFGCETFGISPDIMVVSKQMTSSYLPMAAVLMNARIFDPIADETRGSAPSGTASPDLGHPVAAAVSLENLRIIEERDLVGRRRGWARICSAGCASCRSAGSWARCAAAA